MPSPELLDNNFFESHKKATGEGAEYIQSLAFELASGLQINRRVLQRNLETIADNEGIDTLKNPDLLKNRLGLRGVLKQENTIINPEDRLYDVLIGAYIKGANQNFDNPWQNVESLSSYFSIAFSKKDEKISKSQIMEQLSDMIQMQFERNIRNGILDRDRSVREVIVNPEKLIQYLCIKLQLAGLLE